MVVGKTGIRVIEAMTKKPLVVKPEDSLKNVANLMLKESVGGVVVKEGGKAVGILTEQDLIKIIAYGMDTEKTMLKDVMSTNLIKIDPNDDIYDAILKMNKENVRRLPVINKNGVFRGLLTVKDILIMQPTLIDIRLEGLDIREREDKVREGVCENCESEGFLFKVDGRLLCSACS